MGAGCAKCIVLQTTTPPPTRLRSSRPNRATSSGQSRRNDNRPPQRPIPLLTWPAPDQAQAGPSRTSRVPRNLDPGRVVPLNDEPPARKHRSSHKDKHGKSRRHDPEMPSPSASQVGYSGPYDDETASHTSKHIVVDPSVAFFRELTK
jgi:hypothetical protein